MGQHTPRPEDVHIDTEWKQEEGSRSCRGVGSSLLRGESVKFLFVAQSDATITPGSETSVLSGLFY